MPTKDMRNLSPHAQDAIRERAVALVREGVTQAEAARIFGTTRESVSRWINKAKRHGKGALVSKSRGRPAGGMIRAHEVKLILGWIKTKTPDQLDLPFVLWTREVVGQLIKKRLGYTLAPTTIGKYLRKWGLSPQKPLKRAYERNDKAVRRWLRYDYPALAARVKRAKGVILWADETGIRSDHSAGRSWSPRGVKPVIRGTGKRFGCNVIAALGNRGEFAFMAFTGSFTSSVFIEFLRRVCKTHDRRVFMVVDGHPVHRSRKVKSFVASMGIRLELIQLPAYSPDLNPVELLNNDLKTTIGKTRPTDREELLKTTRSFLYRQQRKPDRVRSYFRQKDVSYAA